MTEVPGMWRPELWHPLAVHLPIGLVIIGSILAICSVIPPLNQKYSFLKPASKLLLLVGVPLIWLAIWTGNEAYEIVGRDLCDPTVKNDHEYFGYFLGWSFTIGTGLFFIAGIFNDTISKYVKIISAAALLLAFFLTGYVGHLGARLVYQQGAAVYQPSEDCKEFE
ncbi:hypothetical protein OO013_19420 [Mangrovivirga sp. M17]|uniref:Uncharacterized protein n=1 Tax=Mangrovivirga halotolerans TaxID=2993936 RepID=A0ABT3RWA1_9BACT|nr:DUF2231 domain-containing protein [Mangrovivirga halotolerans]MCX2746059.1 hypothetical protein [Mangrovivirga halotolerans]